MKKLISITLLSALAAGLAACSGENKEQEQEAETTKSRAASEVSREADAPPPLLIQAMWQRIDAGEWTVSQALISNLKALAQPDGPQGLYGKQKIEIQEPTPIFESARAYVRKHPDSDTAAEIRKLLDRLLPDSETLDQLSAPADAYQGPQGHFYWPEWLTPLSEAMASPAFCRSVIRAQYPEYEEGGLTEPCFIRHDYRGAGGRRESIYVPAAWEDSGDSRRRYRDLAHQAVTDAKNRYGSYGRTDRVDIVLTEGVMGDTYAFVDAWQSSQLDETGNPCLVHVMQPAYGLSDGQFRQAIAHEVFHCFQAWNYPRQKEGPGIDARWSNVILWWGEGTAEYFSNVVYPDVNFEWRNSGRFDAASPDTQVTDMAYDNFLYFQYLGNRLGERGVLDLIAAMPDDGGKPEQRSNLAGFRDMQTLFHEFGQGYLDRDIPDTGGTGIPMNPQPGREYEIGSEQRFDTRPFVLHRTRLKFPGTAPRRVEVEEEGVPGRNQVKKVEEGLESTWQDMPEQVGTGLSVCEAREQNYRFLMTAASGSGERYRATLRLEDAEESGEDLENAAYRYRNFAGAIRQLEEGGPDSLVPDREHGFNISDDQRAQAEANKNPLHCHMLCSLNCICAHPEMHSSRVISEDECYEYTEGGRNVIRWLGGETYTECERQLTKVDPEYRPTAFATIETWCTKQCGEECGWPP